jgi:hypothetical protein
MGHRTKEMALKIYDKMAEAKSVGKSNRTSADPAPTVLP